MPVIVMQSSQTGAGVAVGAAVGVAVSKERRVGVGTNGGVGSQAERVINTISAINRDPVRFPVIDSFLIQCPMEHDLALRMADHRPIVLDGVRLE